MNNLTVIIDDDNRSKVHSPLGRLNTLPFPTRVAFNVELSELTVLCEAQHVAEVEDVLAAFV
jgi:hypothetical protein